LYAYAAGVRVLVTVESTPSVLRKGNTLTCLLDMYKRHKDTPQTTL